MLSLASSASTKLYTTQCCIFENCVSKVVHFQLPLVIVNGSQGRQSVLKSEGDRLENEEVRGYMFP